MRAKKLEEEDHEVIVRGLLSFEFARKRLTMTTVSAMNCVQMRSWGVYAPRYGM